MIKVCRNLALLLSILSVSPLAWSSPSVAWSQGSVEISIGDGGAMTPLSLQLTAGETLQNLSIEAVPSIAPYVSIEPETIPFLEKGHPITVTFVFSLPPGTPERVHRGTIHVRDGRRTLPAVLKMAIDVDFGTVVINPRTRVGSSATLDRLNYVSPDGSLYAFDGIPTELEGMIPGDVLALHASDQLPDGALRMVTDTSFDGTSYWVSSTAAGLADALSEASISIAGNLDSGAGASARTGALGTNSFTAGIEYSFPDTVLFDADGDLSSQGDQIRAGGDISLSASYWLDLQIRQSRLELLEFTRTTNERVFLEISSEIDLLNFEREIELASYRFRPIVIWAGWVPIYLQPVLSLDAGARGHASVGISTSIEQTAAVTTGFRYAEGSITPIADWETSFEYQSPQIFAAAALRGYVGPSLELNLYGIVGPRAELYGYLELNAELGRCPDWWRLVAGIEANVGAQVKVFDRLIASIELSGIIDHSRLLAAADSCPEPPAPPSPTVLLDEDFESGLSPDWSSPTPSAWSVSGGVLQQTSFSPNVRRVISYTPGAAWTDYRVDADLAATGWRHCCSAKRLYARVQSPFDAYVLQPHSDGTVHLLKEGAGGGLMIGTVFIGSTAVRTPARYGLELVGSTISAYRNGTLLFTVEDDTFSYGTVGLESIHIPGTFDNVLVESR